MFRTKCKEHDHSEFYQFLQMEPTHKNNDCYFFYYSTCTKGDNCAFRHEPSALGCEVMCQYWQQGNCFNEHCNFRHMELKKNRKLIQCFWETQRGGCKKPHCPFMHTAGPTPPNPDAANQIKTAEVTSKPVTQEWSNRPDDGKYDGSGTESDQGRGSSEAGSFIGSPAVDPLIVNFDEESDSESAPSPVKAHTSRVPYCKTYEEIRLEEIQAESAAYYSYEPDDYLGNPGGGKEKRVTSLRAARRSVLNYPREKPVKSVTNVIATTTTTTTTGETSASSDFTILTLEEIRRRKAATATASQSTANKMADTTSHRRKHNFEKIPADDSNDFLKDAIKTLAQLKEASGSTKIVEPISRKRNFKIAELYTNVEDDNEIIGVAKISRVPPVRLRRSPKRLNDRSEVIHEASSTRTTIDDDANRSNNRGKEIEVRLCDSSTSDDAQTLSLASAEASKSRDGDDAFLDPSSDDIKLEQFCDTNLNVHDDDYLANVDHASDDILKDIDALLKEKSNV